MTDVAKSIDTMVCTDSTSGVASPASSMYSVSYRAQTRAEPVQPNDSRPNSRRFSPWARSRTVARAGIRPTYQNTADAVKYVLLANTSHSSGERKLTHRGPRKWG